MSGWIRRTGIYWTSHWSKFDGTMERDGPVTYKDHAWVSEGGGYISYPYAVQDDYGNLVAVPGPVMEFYEFQA